MIAHVVVSRVLAGMIGLPLALAVGFCKELFDLAAGGSLVDGCVDMLCNLIGACCV